MACFGRQPGHFPGMRGFGGWRGGDRSVKNGRRGGKYSGPIFNRDFCYIFGTFLNGRKFAVIFYERQDTHCVTQTPAKRGFAPQCPGFAARLSAD